MRRQITSKTCKDGVPYLNKEMGLQIGKAAAIITY